MKHILRFVVCIGVVIAVFFTFNRYIYQKKQQGGSAPAVSTQTTLTGTFSCLPHTDSKGPQTLECALGMLSDTGEYYALDFQKPADPSLFVSGKHVTVSGHHDRTCSPACDMR